MLKIIIKNIPITIDKFINKLTKFFDNLKSKKTYSFFLELSKISSPVKFSLMTLAYIIAVGVHHDKIPITKSRAIEPKTAQI